MKKQMEKPAIELQAAKAYWEGVAAAAPIDLVRQVQTPAAHEQERDEPHRPSPRLRQ